MAAVAVADEVRVPGDGTLRLLDVAYVSGPRERYLVVEGGGPGEGLWLRLVAALRDGSEPEVEVLRALAGGPVPVPAFAGSIHHVAGDGADTAVGLLQAFVAGAEAGWEDPIELAGDVGRRAPRGGVVAATRGGRDDAVGLGGRAPLAALRGSACGAHITHEGLVGLDAPHFDGHLQRVGDGELRRLWPYPVGSPGKRRPKRSTSPGTVSGRISSS